MQVRTDKQREVMAGHDGTWVAHPALVPIATAIFNEYMPQPNQLYKRREDVKVRCTTVVGGWLLHVTGCHMLSDATCYLMRRWHDLMRQPAQVYMGVAGCTTLQCLQLATASLFGCSAMNILLS